MRHLNRALILASCLAIGQLGVRVEAGDEHQDVAPHYEEAVSLLETWLRSILDYDRLPGMSLAIIDDQAMVYANGFGYSDLDRQVKATPDTIYSVCSISKIFTGIAVMQLRDAGKVNLDDPVAHYLPWFSPRNLSPDSQPPTLRDLLRHSGGLPCEPDQTVWTEPSMLFPSHDELIERISNLKMSYPTNTTFNYSNLGYSLLGEVVSVVSGMEYADYVRQHILEPLGLDATTPCMPEDLPGREIAKGYGPWPRTGSRIDIVNYDWKALTPAGGFASTVGDFAKFAMWQFRVLDGKDDTVLNQDTLREMYSVQWPDPPWGLGFTIWHVGDTVFVGHQGGCPGYKSQLILSPKEKIAVVVMVNATDAPQFTLVFRTFEIMAPVLKSPHSEEMEPSKWVEYAGFYTSEKTWSDAEVLSWNDHLAVMWVPGGNGDPIGSLTKLTRVEGEVFRQVGADGKLGKHYIFSRDAEGNVVGLKFNNNVLTKTTR
jgi:CubicO group peptidase (beta-lactamase class C family)